ncbi:MAG: 50S ribosomal protein L29 [Marinilabiliales bacterium]
MKNSEIRQLTLKELEDRIQDEQMVLTRMKINHTVSPLDNPQKIKQTRKVIARLKTELRRRQIEEKTNAK